MTSAYSPYALLRVLVERVGWPDDGQKQLALDSVEEMRRMNIFGNLATMMECEHPTTRGGKCGACGKQTL